MENQNINLNLQENDLQEIDLEELIGEFVNSPKRSKENHPMLSQLSWDSWDRAAKLNIRQGHWSLGLLKQGLLIKRGGFAPYLIPKNLLLSGEIKFALAGEFNFNIQTLRKKLKITV